jgi:hypothetical protein
MLTYFFIKSLLKTCDKYTKEDEDGDVWSLHIAHDSQYTVALQSSGKISVTKNGFAHYFHSPTLTGALWKAWRSK